MKSGGLLIGSSVKDNSQSSAVVQELVNLTPLTNRTNRTNNLT